MRFPLLNLIERIISATLKTETHKQPSETISDVASASLLAYTNKKKDETHKTSL